MAKDSFRTTQLRNQLEAAQTRLQTNPDRKTELETERLEKLITAAERNDAIRAERLAELAKEKAAKTSAHQEQEQAKIEAKLRGEYNRALPTPVTDSEWNKVKADVFHQHRLREMHKTDELVKQAAARYRL